MKVVYEAANGIEAHMIVHMLQQAGIFGRVEGEYLQGAMGELPATGNVRVCVNADAADAARRVIADWEAAQPPAEVSPAQQAGPHKLSYFLAGLVSGLLLAWLLAV